LQYSSHARLGFRSATTEQIPLFDKRLEVLREAGRVLLDRFGASFASLHVCARGLVAHHKRSVLGDQAAAL
jgi:hypothetical protein